MIFVLKVDLVNSQNSQQFIPCQSFKVSSFLNGCCFWFSHLGKAILDLQVNLRFGKDVSQSFKSIQKKIKSSKHVIQKFSFFHAKALVVVHQSGNLSSQTSFIPSQLMFRDSQISLATFDSHILLYSFLDRAMPVYNKLLCLAPLQPSLGLFILPQLW